MASEVVGMTSIRTIILCFALIGCSTSVQEPENVAVASPPKIIVRLSTDDLSHLCVDERHEVCRQRWGECGVNESGMKYYCLEVK